MAKMSVSAIKQVARLLHKQLDQKYYDRCNAIREATVSDYTHTNEAINKYLAAAANKYGIENLVILSIGKDASYHGGISFEYTKKVKKDIDRIKKSCEVAREKRREAYDKERQTLEANYRVGSDMIDGLALSLLTTDNAKEVVEGIEHFIQGI